MRRNVGGSCTCTQVYKAVAAVTHPNVSFKFLLVFRTNEENTFLLFESSVFHDVRIFDDDNIPPRRFRRE